MLMTHTRKMNQLIVAILMSMVTLNAFADNKQYWWQMYDPNSNSPVNLTTDQGSTNAAILNPTGIAAQAAVTAATQPAVTTRIRLTTAVEGNPCSLPKDDIAITADRSLILSCQSSSNTWVNVGGGKVKEIRQFGFPGNGSYDMGVPTATWVCALTYVSGKFAGGGEMMQLIPSTNWIFSGSSQSDQGINGGATCWRFG